MGEFHHRVSDRVVGIRTRNLTRVSPKYCLLFRQLSLERYGPEEDVSGIQGLFYLSISFVKLVPGYCT